MFPFKLTTSNQTWHFIGIQEKCLIGGTHIHRKDCTDPWLPWILYLGVPRPITVCPHLGHCSQLQGLAGPMPIHLIWARILPSLHFHPAHTCASHKHPCPGGCISPKSMSHFSDTRGWNYSIRWESPCREHKRGAKSFSKNIIADSATRLRRIIADSGSQACHLLFLQQSTSTDGFLTGALRNEFMY